MNAHLLTATLLNPAAAAGAPWGAGSGGGEPSSGAAFSRALDGARQSAGASAEPSRAATPPAREPEATRAREPAESGPRRSETAAGPAEDTAPEPSGKREGRGPSPARSTEAGRRPISPSAPRREAARADATMPHPAGPRVEESPEDTAAPAGLRVHVDDITESPANGVTGLGPTALRPAETAPTDTGIAGLPGSVQATVAQAVAAMDGTGRAGNETGAVGLRAGGVGSIDNLAIEPGRAAALSARRPGAAAGRGAEEAAPGGIDVGALGMRAVTAEAGRAFPGAVAEGHAGEGLATLANTTAATPLSATGPTMVAAPVATARGDANAAVAEAGIAAAPGSEDFARELGVQVSVLVREGVQQARLHLNPQELGPVLVRIQLEGQAAQVHMAAEQQPTRQALEQALPALASQLSDAGITLTGGGVFERPPQGFGERDPRDARGGDTARAPGFGANTSEPGSASNSLRVEPGRWSRPRGLVDLIA